MRNKFRINPILKKEMTVGSRSMKMSWAIFGINAFLTMIVFFVLLVISMSLDMNGYPYNSLVWLFPMLAIIECLLISIIIPIITSNSISGERERQTLDIMLTTPISAFSIALGKLETAIAIVMIYMISSIPIMSIAFVLGGLSWWALFGFMALMIYLGIYVGSIGIFCSSLVKKSIAATILTITIGVTILIFTFVIYGFVQGIIMLYSDRIPFFSNWMEFGIAPFIFLFNPYSPFFDFMLRTMSNESMYSIMTNGIGVYDEMPYILKMTYMFWIFFSVVINLIVAFLFLLFAARNIAVTRNRR